MTAPALLLAIALSTVALLPSCGSGPANSPPLPPGAALTTPTPCPSGTRMAPAPATRTALEIAHDAATATPGAGMCPTPSK